MIKQHFGVLSVPSHPSPAPQIRPVNRRRCALYKFIYLLTFTYNFPLYTANQTYFQNYTGSLKVFSDNFGKRGPIIIILSLLHSDLNCERRRHTINHLTHWRKLGRSAAQLFIMLVRKIYTSDCYATESPVGKPVSTPLNRTLL